MPISTPAPPLVQIGAEAVRTFAEEEGAMSVRDGVLQQAGGGPDRVVAAGLATGQFGVVGEEVRRSGESGVQTGFPQARHAGDLLVRSPPAGWHPAGCEARARVRYRRERSVVLLVRECLGESVKHEFLPEVPWAPKTASRRVELTIVEAVVSRHP